MGVALIATLLETWLLSMDVPQAFSGTDTLNWIIADLMMVISICVAIGALRRAFRARTPASAAWKKM